MPVVIRRCKPGGHDVAGHDAQIIGHSTDGDPVYACHQCVRDGGLIPAATFIGRRDLAPIVTTQESP